MNPLDAKKAALLKLLESANSGLHTDLQSRYAPKPPPPAEAPPEPTPQDPLAGADDELLEGLLAAAKYHEPADVAPNKAALTTTGYDPNLRDEYGQAVPKDEKGNQYTLEGLKRMRAADPEWNDKRRALKQSVLDEEG